MKGNNADWKRALGPARWIGLALLLAGARPGFTQGTLGPVVVLRTGAGVPLVSSMQPVGFFNAGGPAFFQFAYGFSTDEEPTPGVFHDSFTLTLGAADGSLSVIYNTTDRSGAYWAPNAPGSIFISADAITRQVISFPVLSPTNTHQFAYLVTAPVPNELLGRNLNFYADLFDNQNGIGSLGWFSVAPIPEPSTWVLAGAALLLLVVFHRRNQ